jgi:hypothetical protein
VIDYSQLVQQPATKHPDFFVLNSAQLVANTLNNNEVVRSVEDFLERFGDRFATGAGAPPATLNVAA